MDVYAELKKFKANLPAWAKVGEAEKAEREKAAHKRKLDAMLKQEMFECALASLEKFEASEAKAEKTSQKKLYRL